MLRRMCLAGSIAMVVVTATTPAFASDHLFNASNAPGAVMRGFVNPVRDNPSGMSFGMARPQTVPGEGDPKVGGDIGTPAVDLTLVNVRSGGHGDPDF